MGNSSLSKTHLGNIDLLRGLASLMVCFFHLTESLSDTSWLKYISHNGWLGVQVFFVISGFIIPYSLYQNKYQLKHIIPFLKKRWIRIEPPYLITIGLTLLNFAFFSVIRKNPFHLEWERILLHIVYLPDFFGYEWFNVIFWTLAQEFQFYLFMALCFPLFIHQRKWIIYVAITLFATPFFLYNDGRLLTNNSSLFLMGIITFLYFIKRLHFIEFIILILLNSCYMYFFQFQQDYKIWLITLFTVIAILYLRFNHVIGKFTGKISYSLYLTHGLIGGNFLLFTINIKFVDASDGFKTFFVLIAICLSVAFAYLFYLLVEKPSQALSKKIKYR